MLEHRIAPVRAAYAALAAHDRPAAARLRPTYLAYLGDPGRRRPFERALESEISRQSRSFRQTTTLAREAVAGLIVVAALLVLTLFWLFELERRAGRIDRDNAARAAELIRIRDEFVAVVSHELRTPLTSIIGYVELLTDDEAGALTDEQRAYLEIVQRSTARLVELVGDLLLVAEAERGPLALDLGHIDFAEIVAYAVEAARPAADARRIALVFDAGEVGAVAGDATRLAQMVDNLIANAIKFTPEGGRVTVHAGRRGGDALFEVKDTGTGISEADRERLFDPFFRSRDANARAVPGTGLGLTITKAIVDAHGGTIDVETTPGGGATFRVCLPIGERVATLQR